MAEVNNPTIEDIGVHYDAAYHVAMYHVERLARGILRKSLDLREFVMANGVWFFANYNDEYTAEDSRSAKLSALFDEWDQFLHMTGTPMRFTAEGPVITDW